MKERFANYLDSLFASYEDARPMKELKEELATNLQERFDDLKAQGHDDETAYRMSIESIGDVSEVMETINARVKNLPQPVRDDLSSAKLVESDLRGVQVHDGKFNYSDLKRSDFSGADLTNSSFLCSDLAACVFEGTNLSGAKISMAQLKGSRFRNCILDYTSFNSTNLAEVVFENQVFIGTVFDKSSLSGTHFKNATLRNVTFKHSDVKKAIFDGVTMDKVTYAVLKGSGADLSKVTVI